MEGQCLFVLSPHLCRTVAANPINRNFYAAAVGYYPKALGHERERRYGSSDYILIYCVAGSGEISFKGSKLALKAGNYFIIPQGLPHKYRSSATDPWSIYWMHFNGGMATELFDRSGLRVHEVGFDENRVAVFHKLCTILNHGYSKREIEISNFKALHFVTSLIYHREIDPQTNNVDAIDSSIAFMKDNIGVKISLKELAQKQNVSITYYSKMFRQKTGSSPVNYFNELKIQRSCQELFFTDKSIKKICAELGFDDQYYFSRLFSKVTGISPSMYKQIQKKKSANQNAVD